jgi:hypothetical protein
VNSIPNGVRTMPYSSFWLAGRTKPQELLEPCSPLLRTVLAIAAIHRSPAQVTPVRREAAMAIVPAPYSFVDGIILLGGEPLAVVTFPGEPDVFWFKAKPIHSFTGAANIVRTLERVDNEDKGSLSSLVEAKGLPGLVTPGYQPPTTPTTTRARPSMSTSLASTPSCSAAISPR